jgi:hypothetical protein
MTSTTDTGSPAEEALQPRRPGSRKRYRRPRLQAFGDIRGLTLGNTPGGIESGGIPRKPLGT